MKLRAEWLRLGEGAIILLPRPLRKRGVVRDLQRLTPHPNLPPPRGRYTTFLINILRFAQYDGTWDNLEHRSSPRERLGEGSIILLPRPLRERGGVREFAKINPSS